MNHTVVRWARETAGLTLVQAAHALGLPSTDRLQRIEDGEEPPSRPLLLKMCKTYRRSLLTFYLSAPPRKSDSGQDFRTLPPDRTVADDALLDALMRDITARQNMVRSIVVDEEEGQALPFIGSATIQTQAASLANSIATRLGARLDEYRAKHSSGQAFAYLREKAEAQGIFVLLIGNLGNHHSTISLETFRGFAIADRFAPFIVINDQDSKTAWSFTLLHELAHLWLGQSGVSGTNTEQAVERFCNEVAAAFLLPQAELAALTLPVDQSDEQWMDFLTLYCLERHLSRKMVAYGLLRAGRIVRSTWLRLDLALDRQWQVNHAHEREQARSRNGKPSFYVVRRHRLGSALLSLVDRTLGAGTLTPVKAAKLLGVKPRSVHPLLLDRPTGGQSLRSGA